MSYLEIATPPDPRQVLNRWNRQYGKHYDAPDGAKWRRIRDELKALDPPNKADIDRIIGNDSWTSLTCDGCYERTIRAIRVVNTTLCAGCLRAGLDMLG